MPHATDIDFHFDGADAGIEAAKTALEMIEQQLGSAGVNAADMNIYAKGYLEAFTDVFTRRLAKLINERETIEFDNAANANN